IRFYLIESLKEVHAVEYVSPGVDLVDFLFVDIGVLILHNGHNRIIPMAQNASVTGGIFHFCGENGSRGILMTMAFDQFFNGLSCKEGCIPHEDNNVTAFIWWKKLFCADDRMTGTQSLFLKSEIDMII